MVTASGFGVEGPQLLRDEAMELIWGIERPAFKTVMKKRLSERKNLMRVPVTKTGKNSDGDTFIVPTGSLPT